MKERDRIKATFAANMGSAERTAAWLRHSIEALRERIPLDAAAVTSPDPSVADALDAFAKRFEQLQDTLGRRLFRGAALLSGEDPGGMTNQDLADFMEKLGVVPSADVWIENLLLRNKLAHDYPDAPEKRATRLTEAHAAAEGLVEVLARLRRLAREKGWLDP